MDSNAYRNRARKRVIAVIVLLAAAAGVYWYFSRSDSLRQLVTFENSVQKTAVKDVERQFSAPPPLRMAASSAPPHTNPNAATASPYALSQAGVVADTNAARKQNGNLAALAENPTLDRIAELRLEDMFAKQYFAHVSPSSSSAETVANQVGYGYLAIGENLALGNFEGDGGVVAAWMKSPGHRANILNIHFTQIGVAVQEGIFQGERTWLAVQIFGRPAADCPAPDANLKSAIDAAENGLIEVGAELQARRAQVQSMPQNDVSAYNDAVNAYNNLAEQYQALAAQAKASVAQYNAEVNAFNQCIAE